MGLLGRSGGGAADVDDESCDHGTNEYACGCVQLVAHSTVAKEFSPMIRAMMYPNLFIRNPG